MMMIPICKHRVINEALYPPPVKQQVPRMLKTFSSIFILESAIYIYFDFWWRVQPPGIYVYFDDVVAYALWLPVGVLIIAT